MKKIIIGAAGLLFSFLLFGGIKEIAWRFYYTEPVSVGFVQSGSEGDIEKVSWEWFKENMNARRGWRVPYSVRVDEAWIDKTEILEPGYIQLNYTIRPASTNLTVIMNLDLICTEYRNRYSGQKVLHWEYENGVWVLEDIMSPVQYQIQSPEFQEELRQPQTQHYAMAENVDGTYVAEDEILYVTYDGGEHVQEVPDGYEKVCRETNGTYNELLPAGSYIVSQQFTAFAAYSQAGCSLLYSLDAGVTWQESFIYAGGYKANSFISKTADACYVTFACDRSLGSDYYTTYRSADFRTWEKVQIPQETQSNLTLAYWSESGTGYYAKQDSYLYVVSEENEQGANIIAVNYPAAQEIIDELKVDPFDTPEYMYEENGVLYMVVGQGDDGDYTRDGKMVKALYQLEDGSHFVFVKEIEDTTQLAG